MPLIELLADPGSWIALASLTALEIVLGIDNIVFIAIVTARLPAREQILAYRIGLSGALFTRIGLLLTISWIMGLSSSLFAVLGNEFSGRDLIMLGGGVFLIGKSAHEIYEKVEGEDESLDDARGTVRRGLVAVIAQIIVLDVVFSLDSVITAVGMVDADKIPIMIAAILIAVLVMLIFARPVGNFVNKNPSTKVLALAFLMLIGVLLTAEAFDRHISKGYIYFAMGFALLVEMLNIRLRRKKPTPQVEQS